MNSSLTFSEGKFILLITFALGFMLGVHAQPSRQAKVEPESSEQAAIRLRDMLLGAIRNAKGDPEHQNIHLVIGFSTGHFSGDPLAAEASRMIAWALVRDTLIERDQVSCYAWEMHIWDHPRASDNPLIVQSDGPEGKNKIKDLFPLTTRQGSRGGHDTERAIVEIVQRLQNVSNAAIVLLTNTAASISTPGTKVIGADNADYRLVLQQWKRLPSVNKSGASLELPYIVSTPTGGRLERSLDAVILVPVAFQGESLISGTRTARLTNPAPPTEASPPKSAPNLWPTVILLVLVGIAATVACLLKMFGGARGSWVLDVNGRKFEPFTVPDGEEVCQLAGVGYDPVKETTVILNGVPPIRAARIFRSGKSVRLENDRMRILTVNGVHSSEPTLKPGQNHKIILSGEYAENPGLPPRQIEVEVDVKLVRV